MSKKISIFLLVLMLSSLACMQSAALSSSSPTLTPTPTPTATITKPALTVASLAPEPMATASEPAQCKVIALEALNLRNGAGVSFGVIAWLEAGEILTLTNQPTRGAWIEVTTASNTTGWINSLYCER